METQTVKPGVGDRLEALGFKRAATVVKEISARKRKLALAYEHYRFVRPELIDEFNYKLKQKTLGSSKADPLDQTYQELAFCNIADYEGTPPAEVLDALEIAQGRKCFDSYEIGYIRNVKDPLLFGRINRCGDRFFIAQWDDDVKIEDILKANEG